MTEPLDPKVAGPLLVWAIRVVEDFSGVILAAWAENRRLTALAGSTPGSSAGRAALEEYLLPLIRSGSPLPTNEHRCTTMLARTYIAATTGASPAQLDRFGMQHGLTALAVQRPGPCPLDVPSPASSTGACGAGTRTSTRPRADAAPGHHCRDHLPLPDRYAAAGGAGPAVRVLP
jgi:hypothetical protein